MKVAMHDDYDDHHAHDEAAIEEEEAEVGSAAEDASASESRYLMAAGRLINLGLRLVGI